MAELTKKLSACQGQLSTAQERCSQLDKEKQQAVSDLQTSRQVFVSRVLVHAWVCICGRACNSCSLHKSQTLRIAAPDAETVEWCGWAWGVRT